MRKHVVDQIDFHFVTLKRIRHEVFRVLCQHECHACILAIDVHPALCPCITGRIFVHSCSFLQFVETDILFENPSRKAIGLEYYEFSSVSCLFGQDDGLQADVGADVHDGVSFFDKSLEGLEVHRLPAAIISDLFGNSLV